VKASEIIVARLGQLGYGVLEPPRRVAHWSSAAFRAAGTACWTAVVRPPRGGHADLLSWDTMTDLVRAPVSRWRIDFSEMHGQYELGLAAP
jgi:hypothetical protein